MTREEEALNLLHKMGYKVIKESLEDIYEDEEFKNAVKDLADKTNNDIDDVDINYNDNRGTVIQFGDEEYLFYTTYDNAVEAAEENEKELIDECGGVLEAGIRFENLGGIDQYLDEDDLKSVVREYEESVIEDMSDEELQDEYDTTDKEEVLDKRMEDIDDYVEYIKMNWGDEMLDELIKNNSISFDIDQLVEDVVNTDGPANSLASYDGEEIELENGYYAYRIN